MKIYLSEFSVADELARKNSYHDDVDRLVAFCAGNKIELCRSNEFTDYDTIDYNIRNSDILIAYINEYWLSSTWKLHEVCYALGDYVSMGKEKLKANNVTVVLFYVEAVNAPILKNIKTRVKVIKTINELENYILAMNTTNA